MPGFASKYEGTNRVDLGDGYWVDVKKTLTYAEADDAEKAGIVFRMDMDMDPSPGAANKPRTSATLDPDAKLFEQVLASVVDWNLDNDDGTPWPLDYDRDAEKAKKVKAGGQGQGWKSPRRKSLERLPKPIFDLVASVVGRSNLAPGQQERQSFRSGSIGSAPVGALEPPDDKQVLPGGGLAPAPGAEGGPASAG